MNKYYLFLRALSVSLALFTLPLAYGADDADGDGIPDSQDADIQPSGTPQGNAGAQQKISSREKKAQGLEKKAKDLRSKAEKKKGKEADKLIKKAEGLEKDAAKLRHIETGKAQGMSKKEAKKDFKVQRKAQNPQ